VSPYEILCAHKDKRRHEGRPWRLDDLDLVGKAERSHRCAWLGFHGHLVKDAQRLERERSLLQALIEYWATAY
jgi:hypothetical protein